MCYHLIWLCSPFGCSVTIFPRGEGRTSKMGFVGVLRPSSTPMEIVQWAESGVRHSFFILLCPLIPASYPQALYQARNARAFSCKEKKNSKQELVALFLRCFFLHLKQSPLRSTRLLGVVRAFFARFWPCSWVGRATG